METRVERIRNDLVNKVILMHSKGMKVHEVASAIKCTPTTVYKILQQKHEWRPSFAALVNIEKAINGAR